MAHLLSLFVSIILYIFCCSIYLSLLSPLSFLSSVSLFSRCCDLWLRKVEIRVCTAVPLDAVFDECIHQLSYQVHYTGFFDGRLLENNQRLTSRRGVAFVLLHKWQQAGTGSWENASNGQTPADWICEQIRTTPGFTAGLLSFFSKAGQDLTPHHLIDFLTDQSGVAASAINKILIRHIYKINKPDPNAKLMRQKTCLICGLELIGCCFPIGQLEGKVEDPVCWSCNADVAGRNHFSIYGFGYEITGSDVGRVSAEGLAFSFLERNGRRVDMKTYGVQEPPPPTPKKDAEASASEERRQGAPPVDRRYGFPMEIYDTLKPNRNFENVCPRRLTGAKCSVPELCKL